MTRALSQVLDGAATGHVRMFVIPESPVIRINAAGGKLEPALGVSVEEVPQRRFPPGLPAVTLDGNRRFATTAALRETAQPHRPELEPCAVRGPARIAVSGVVARRIQDVGTAGHAGDDTVLSLEEMAKTYAGSPVGA